MTHNNLRDTQYKNASNLSKRGNLHARFSTNPHGWFRWLFEQYDVPTVACMLELGCGPAWQWQHNADRIPPGWDVTLTDFSPGMIEEAQHTLADVPHAFTLLVMDAQSLEFGDATFDAVFAHHMLYHVPDRARALREVRRVLKPGGTLFASTSGPEHLQELQQLRLGFDQAHDWLGEIGLTPDVVEFNRETGRAQLESVFEQVEWRDYPDSLAVTEAEPLADFIMSTGNSGTEVWRAAFNSYVQAELDRRGVIPITKASGVFVCRR